MSLYNRKPTQQVARLPLTNPRRRTDERHPIRPGDHVLLLDRARPRKVAAVHGIIDSPSGWLRWEVEFTDGQRVCAGNVERHATQAELDHYARVA